MGLLDSKHWLNFACVLPQAQVYGLLQLLGAWRCFVLCFLHQSLVGQLQQHCCSTPWREGAAHVQFSKTGVAVLFLAHWAWVKINGLWENCPVTFHKSELSHSVLNSFRLDSVESLNTCVCHYSKKCWSTDVLLKSAALKHMSCVIHNTGELPTRPVRAVTSRVTQAVMSVAVH